ncbi:MAG: LysR family transcriptional regulator, partial [Rhizobiales bacterium]|nr:LysR family transcriptional regulator [Hyphomicrobiales bacterium]
VAIMYAPQHRPGLMIDLLREEELVLVTTDPASHASSDKDYVHVDWGPDFALRHDVSFPDATPGLHVNLGPLGLGYILAAGGSGYFRVHAIQPYLASGQLHIVPGAARFASPVYAVYSAPGADALLEPALAGLHSVSRQTA